MILNSPYITGSITVTGNTTIQGSLIVTGSLSGTASLASNSNLLQGTGSVGFATTASLLAVSSSQQQISSSQQQISSSLLTLTASYAALSSSYTALSGSYNTFSGSASTRTTQIEQTYATTGSNSFRANQSITGSLVVSSTITAQTLVVQTVTSSIVYSSGSNNFGNQLSNNQTFTGSVNITGSLALAGNITGNAITLIGALSGTSANFNSALTAAGATLNGNTTISVNHNSLTRLIISNTTVGSSAYVETSFTSDSSAGSGAVGKFSSTSTTYKITTASNTYLYNGSTAGDIAILNDFASGAIKMAAGGSSTSHFTIASTGAATFSSSVQASSIKLNTATSNGYFHIETSLPWGTKSNDLVNFTGYGYEGNIYTEHNYGSINWFSGAVKGASITAWRNLPADGDLFDIAFSTNPGGNNITERMRITKSGAVGIGTTNPAAPLHVVGNQYIGKLGGGGNYKQTVVGQTTAAASGTSKKIAYVGFSHSVRVYVWANQNASNGSSAIADFTTLYGASTGGTTSEASFGNVSDIVVAYDNGGSPAYTINVTLTYSGAAPTINYIVEGINHDNNIYTIA